MRMCARLHVFEDFFVVAFGQLTKIDMIGLLALSFGQCQVQSFVVGVFWRLPGRGAWRFC